MRGSVGKLIRNDESTEIEGITWTSSKTKVGLNPTPEACTTQRPRCVKDLVDPSGIWDTHKVNTWCNDESINAILATHIPQERQMDHYIWIQNDNGEYTVKSGY